VDESRYAAYLASLGAEHPGLRVVSKDGDPLSRAIDRALRVLTFGGQRQYLTAYTTVLGRTIYVPIGWERRSVEERYVTMRHEAVHLRQLRRLGLVPMALL